LGLVLILETWLHGGRWRPGSLLSPFLAIALMGAGCRAESNDAGAQTGRGPEAHISLVASVYPLVEVARRVGGERAAVTSLTPTGSEPHDFELTARSVDAIEDADVLLYLGEGFQPAVEEMAERRDGVTIDLLEGKPLLARPAGDEHAEEEEAGHREGRDPHVWLDPMLMIQMVGQIVQALSQVDPTGAQAYERNAAGLVAELEVLHADFQSGLAGCRRRTIVTSHAAFGYLAARYGLEQESISGLSPEAEPDPDRLDELAELVEREGVTTIFTETLVSPEVAETLAREAGVITAILNPLEGLSDEEVEAGENYASVMRRNLATLKEALGCA
jgi:zinc transport system substrate-binding protein